jgi:hypothetical protein
VEQYELDTNGVNLDPFDTDQGSVSTAHLDLQFTAEFLGETLEMHADKWVCGSGCRAGVVADDGQTRRDVSIVRFAKYGRAQLATGQDFTWLVTLEEGRGLIGTWTTSGTDDSGFLVLSMGMQIAVKLDDQDGVLTFRSRKTPILAGPVAGWPPYNARLDLVNAPIEYLLAEEADASKVPGLIVHANHATIGPTDYPLLSVHPEIHTARLVDRDGRSWKSGEVAGVVLGWTDTAELVEDTLPISSYHIYRSFAPRDPNRWEQIASVPSGITSFTDNGFDGKAAAGYIVMHAADLVLGYELEGLFGAPYLVPSVE